MHAGQAILALQRLSTARLSTGIYGPIITTNRPSIHVFQIGSDCLVSSASLWISTTRSFGSCPNQSPFQATCNIQVRYIEYSNINIGTLFWTRPWVSDSWVPRPALLHCWKALTDCATVSWILFLCWRCWNFDFRLLGTPKELGSISGDQMKIKGSLILI